MPITPDPLPSLDWPDLDRASDRGGPVTPVGRPEAFVRFLDRTTRLCKVLAWRQDPGGWAVHLQWGVSGRIRSGWYVYDAERVEETGGAECPHIARADAPRSCPDDCGPVRKFRH